MDKARFLALHSITKPEEYSFQPTINDDDEGEVTTNIWISHKPNISDCLQLQRETFVLTQKAIGFIACLSPGDDPKVEVHHMLTTERNNFPFPPLKALFPRPGFPPRATRIHIPCSSKSIDGGSTS